MKPTQGEILNFLARLWDGNYEKEEKNLQLYKETRRIVMVHYKRNK